MSMYMSLVSYTQQGIANIKDSTARMRRCRKAVAALGGKIHAVYLTMGRFDGVFISEFPDDATFARFALSLASSGFMFGNSKGTLANQNFARSSVRSGEIAKDLEDRSGRVSKKVVGNSQTVLSVGKYNVGRSFEFGCSSFAPGSWYLRMGDRFWRYPFFLSDPLAGAPS